MCQTSTTPFVWWLFLEMLNNLFYVSLSEKSFSSITHIEFKCNSLSLEWLMKEAWTGHNIFLLCILYVLFLCLHLKIFKTLIQCEVHQKLNSTHNSLLQTISYLDIEKYMGEKKSMGCFCFNADIWCAVIIAFFHLFSVLNSTCD